MLDQTFYSRTGKRWLDLAGAISGLIVLAPFLVVVAVAVRLTSPGPAFFRQVRVGQFGKPFRIFKFRTMVGKSAGPGALLTAAGDPRITPLGRWLRNTKIDELPQLMNVLLGDMSLVGPRPEVPTYVATYNERQRTVLVAKPGVTGISANVREEELLASHADKEAFYLSTILPAKLEIDIAYCEKIRLVNDLKMILSTAITVVAWILERSSPFPRSCQRET